MAKVNKIYPPFFNGVSQQNPELMLDNQCKEMVNCVPSLVEGLKKRPPVSYVTRGTNSLFLNSHIFHTYDRGEDDEEYIFLYTGDYNTPIMAFNKAGQGMNVEINTTNATTIKNYLNNGNLKGLTVQDRTWLVSRDALVDLDYSATEPLKSNYDREAFYWLKRGSGDKYNPYNYAVYIDNTAIEVAPVKPANDDYDLETGAEDTDFAASVLADRINGTNNSGWNSTTIVEGEETIPNPDYSSLSGFTAVVVGSILKITKDNGGDFEFSSWDSWGLQASEGWKGSVNKVTDLPKEFPFDDVYVQIQGSESNEYTDYYVEWNGSSWQECLDPQADRGQLTNMPIKMDRTALVNGVATFTIDVIDWSLPRVGNEDNNPDPSFVNYPISDLFFYKNRLGLASSDSVVLSEAANYTNFYVSTALDIIDTDVIDVAVASNQASKIYFVKPFNNSLYIFTKYSQYELTADGGLTPQTVSLNVATNYPMDINVEPVVMNNSLYFISTTNNRQQLREYIKTEKLNVKGIDLNVSTPTYLEDTIVNLQTDGVLGMVLCCTANNKIYLYRYTEDGEKRIQSSWSTWSLLEELDYTAGTFEYNYLGNTLTVTCKTATDYRYHTMELDHNIDDDREDITYEGAMSYESSILLPDFYPKFSDIRTPKDKILIKKIKVEGEGSFDVDLYRKDYKTTFTKSHTLSMQDLDLHVASKVGNVELTIKDSTVNDFVISSIILEGLYTATSKEIK
jgi:hypothetical protein